MVEPRPLIGQAGRGEPEQVLDRPLRTERRRMQAAHRGKGPIRAVAGRDRDIADRLFEQRHVHAGALAPQCEQGEAPRGKLGRQRLPVIAADLDALPRLVPRHAPPAGERIGERRV